MWKDVVNKSLDGHDIESLKEDIKEIKDDTKWTRAQLLPPLSLF
ncbi:hypothetical protein [Jeotgalibacillus marinus]|uniref:Uncharacterized protein n=1 Tax=Jeotgalibacillus marinus TaxID=86667 RepID=A0ABV3Q1N3_9BACL